MKIVCDAQSLNTTLTRIGRIIPTRKALAPITQYLRLDAAGGRLSMSCTDVEMSATLDMEAEVTEEGICLMPGRLLADVVKAVVHEKAEVEMETNDRNGLNLKCHHQNINLVGTDAGDFPDVPRVDGKRFLVPNGVWASMISKVAPIGQHQDGTRPVLTGVLVEIRKDGTTFVAADGFRLARLQSQGIETDEDVTFLVGAARLVEFHRLMGRASDDIQLTLPKTLGGPTPGNIRMSAPGLTFTVPLIPGQFPRYEEMIPEETNTQVTADRQELVRAVGVAGAGQDGEALWFTIEEKPKSRAKKKPWRILIEGGLTDPDAKVKTHADLDAKVSGPGLKFGVNKAYLLESLKSIETDQVILKFEGQSKPIWVGPDSDEELLHLIMPMFDSRDAERAA